MCLYKELRFSVKANSLSVINTFYCYYINNTKQNRKNKIRE